MAFSCGKLLRRFWLGAYLAWKLQGKEEGCPLTGGCPHWAPGPLSSAGRSSTTRAHRRMTGPKEAPRGTQGRASMEAAFRVGPEGAPLQQLGSDTDPRRHEVLRASKDYNMGGLEPQKFIVAQFWRPKSSCGAGHAPSEGAGERDFPDLASGSLQHSFACRWRSSSDCVSPGGFLSVLVCLWVQTSPVYKDSSLTFFFFFLKHTDYFFKLIFIDVSLTRLRATLVTSF